MPLTHKNTDWLIYPLTNLHTQSMDPTRPYSYQSHMSTLTHSPIFSFTHWLTHSHHNPYSQTFVGDVAMMAPPAYTKVPGTLIWSNLYLYVSICLNELQVWGNSHVHINRLFTYYACWHTRRYVYLHASHLLIYTSDMYTHIIKTYTHVHTLI